MTVICYHLSALHYVFRPSLTPELSSTIRKAIVRSSPEYCNVLHEAVTEIMKKLQRLQNQVARAVAGVGRRAPVQAIQNRVQWHPVLQRFTYKLEVLIVISSWTLIKLNLRSHAHASISQGMLSVHQHQRFENLYQQISALSHLQ